jgi:hypothetical protein
LRKKESSAYVLQQTAGMENLPKLVHGYASRQSCDLPGAYVQLYRALGGGWQQEGNVSDVLLVNEGQSVPVFP